MSREAVYHAVILKKQAYGDADEIVTFYSLETGRIRGLAKSIKLPQSKLQNALQGLFYVRVVLARGSRLGAGSLRKIIRCEVLDTFMSLRASLESAKAGLFASEAVYKATADEQKNSRLFGLLLEFLRSLSGESGKTGCLPGLLAKFQISLLETLGFAVHVPAGLLEKSAQLYFTPCGGGFSLNTSGPDHVRVGRKLVEAFFSLKKNNFTDAGEYDSHEAGELNELLGGFLEYQLERRLHARNLFAR